MDNLNMNNEYVSFLKVKTKYKGIFSWIFSTDHKRIGILYMIGMLTFFSIAVGIGVLMKLEMLTPGKTLYGPEMYNALFTLHGVIMIFLFIIPGIPAIFGNFFLPIQIGAADVSFPRLNLFSWWLFIIGSFMAIASLFFSGGPVDVGWTFYVPYSLRSTTNVTFALSAVLVLGFSSILTGLNFITTIHRMRVKGMTFFKMPLFVWALYSTGWIQVIATPVVGITIILTMVERTFGVGIFDPALGGDPILYQHLFWIYSHPAVYIMILPAMGIVSEIIPTFAQRTIFGYKAIAFSSLAIAFVGYFVWAHHMFTTGISDTARMVFSLLTFLVAIPSGVKIFNWVATLYKGSITLGVPLLYVMAFIFLFSIGGLTGLVLGSLATNVQTHDTYFVVAHFHYVMFGGTAIILFAGMHYWFPKMFGKMYNEKAAKIALVFIFVGFNVLYFTMFILGYMGMPRRYWDYLPEYQYLHIISTIGSWILVPGLIIMFVNLLISLKKGKPASMNPWGGVTLEWTVPSPPPLENFDKLPVITNGPYEFAQKPENLKEEK